MTDSTQGHGPAADPRGQFASQCTDFHQFPHQQLLRMIEQSSPEKINAIADKLKTAAKTIKGIGKDLKDHMTGLDWEGQGADAFHTWGADMANATTRLGDYSQAAGSALHEASVALRHAKTTMPKYPADAKATLDSFNAKNPKPSGLPDLGTGNSDPSPNFTLQPSSGPTLNNGPTPVQATLAANKLKEAHDAAARAMFALESSYNARGTDLTKATRPNFPPMPRTMMPSQTENGFEYVSLPGGSGSGREPGGGGYGSAGAIGGSDRGAGSSGVAGTHGGGAGASGSEGTTTGGVSLPHADHSSPSTDSSTRSDGGVKTVPPTPNIPTTPNGGPPTTPSPGGPPVPPPVGRPHVPAPHIPTVPPVTPKAPGRVPPSPRPEGRTGPVGTGPTGPGSTGTRRVPGVPGSGPGAGRVGLPQTGSPRVPAGEVIGGQPTPRATGPTPLQTPRGTVVGAESVQGTQGAQGRPGMAGPGFGGMPGSPGGGGRGIGAGGRRLASEAGGVVGGSTPNGGRAFTQGGTGLVRNPGDRKASRGKRPDYLVEDEESWSSDDEQRNVPPVIG
ncbi:hypothetical protein I5Q34_00640 [Streptomyces sp. AV19]|uniref:WXG100 family type VII secretion target n=1 Tax=Streptomyces sp. AV19 TaxID=2793068 RepID=UPI0018FE6932|nr:WXG100 family type VII secretion target [Streptomyces sp. AV19]MBH1932815.1 hypothetical protein [Streptomyces sp. AV19]MDG4531480.1 hypothetical protein [Streptomyces sp. AV19]